MNKLQKKFAIFKLNYPDYYKTTESEVEADYEKHANSAKKIIEEYFEAKKVLAELLEHCLS